MCNVEFTNVVNAPKPMDEKPIMFCTKCCVKTEFNFDKVLNEVATGDDLYIYYCKECNHPVYIIK